MDNVIEIIINAIDQTAAGFNTAITNTESLGKAADALATVSVAAMGAAALAVGVLTGKAIENAAAMGEMAQKVGVPVQEFSKLADAAKITNVSAEQLQIGFKKLDVAMAEAADNADSKAGRAFSSMGISVTDANGKLKASEAVLLEVADKFSTYADGANKTTIAQTLFGKSGLDMIQMLNKGAEEIQNLGNTSDGVSAQFAANAIKFEENNRQMSVAIEGIGRTVAASLLPSLLSAQQAILDFTSSTGAASAVGLTFGDIIKGLAVAFNMFTMGLEVGVKVLAEAALVAGVFFYDVLRTAANIVLGVSYAIIDLVKTFGRLGEAVSHRSDAIMQFLSGDWSGAAKSANAAALSIGDAVVAAYEEIKKDSKMFAGDTAQAWKDGMATIKTTMAQTGDEITKAEQKWWENSVKLFSDPIPIKAKLQVDAPNPNDGAGDEAFAQKQEQALQFLQESQEKFNAESLEGTEKLIAESENAYNAFYDKVEKMREEGLITGVNADQAEAQAYQSMVAKMVAIQQQQVDKAAALSDKMAADSLKGLNKQLADAKKVYDAQELEIKKLGDFDGLQSQRMAQNAAELAAKKKQIMETSFTDTVDILGQLGSAVQSFGTAGLIAYKAIAISQTIINTAMAVMKALAQVPWPYDVVQAGLYSALGAAQIAKISGVAHDGLDYVPREGTYLLDEGEAVLNKQENAARMQGQGGYGGGEMQPIILHLDGRELGRGMMNVTKSGYFQLSQFVKFA